MGVQLKMKCICGSELFRIKKLDNCFECENNGAYSPGDGYVYDKKQIEDESLERNQAVKEGECLFGSCWDDAGCYMFICAKCNKKTNLAIMEE